MPEQVLPVAEKPRGSTPGWLSSSLYMLAWIISSNSTILFNKWIIDNAGFRYPIILTSWHLLFATIVTQILSYTTNLLESRHSLPINKKFYLRTLLPIGLTFTGSLITSNMAYLYLSVAFIQMLKATGPVSVLFFSWVWGVANPSLGTVGNILLIVGGVAITSVGELQWSWIGFILQMAGIVFEAIRLVMTQVMLTGEGLKMDPLVGLYYYAPVCAAFNVIVALIVEGPSFDWSDLDRVGYGILFANALVAFMLHITSVLLIGKTSGLVMTLTSIFKSILLIVFSVIVWNTPIVPLQAFGYLIALSGLVYYSFGYETMLAGWHNTIAFSKSFWKAPPIGEGRFMMRVCRYALLFFVCMASLYVGILGLHRYGYIERDVHVFGHEVV